MRLTERLVPQAIDCEFLAGDKQEAIAGLVDLLDQAYGPLDRRAVLQAVINREELFSTGVGGGVALPHARSEAVKDVLLGLGLSAKPIDFDAQDGQTVRIFFMIVGPVDKRYQKTQLEVEARISTLLKQAGFCQALLEAKNPEQVLACIRSFEERCDQ